VQQHLGGAGNPKAALQVIGKTYKSPPKKGLRRSQVSELRWKLDESGVPKMSIEAASS